jgi:vacuolar protein sorting-associated protein 3
MQSAQKGTGSRKRRLAVPETGPFVLRSLLEDVPLSAEGGNDDIEINCVEFLGECAYCKATGSLYDACFYPSICPDADVS